MEHWRKKAVEIFPELGRELRDSDITYSVYTLYYHHMLKVWETAARTDDLQLARKVLSLVEWGMQNSDYDVCNAAQVSFLEHIPDEPLWLQYAERVMPEHLYKLAIELSASLLKSVSNWRTHLDASVNRYNEYHNVQLSIVWP